MPYVLLYLSRLSSTQIESFAAPAITISQYLTLFPQVCYSACVLLSSMTTTNAPTACEERLRVATVAKMRSPMFRQSARNAFG